MKGLVQMKFFLKSFHHFRSELGIHGIHLARLAGGNMNDQKRYDGDEKQGNNFLDSTASDK